MYVKGVSPFAISGLFVQIVSVRKISSEIVVKNEKRDKFSTKEKRKITSKSIFSHGKVVWGFVQTV